MNARVRVAQSSWTSVIRVFNRRVGRRKCMKAKAQSIFAHEMSVGQTSVISLVLTFFSFSSLAWYSPPSYQLFLLSPPLLSRPLILPSSLGVERPSVFQMKRWVVCLMWCTRWLLGCSMSQHCSYICSVGPPYTVCVLGTEEMEIYLYPCQLDNRHLHEMKWCLACCTGGFWAEINSIQCNFIYMSQVLCALAMRRR